MMSYVLLCERHRSSVRRKSAVFASLNGLIRKVIFLRMLSFASMQPTAFVFKSPRFGSLILNMTSREAAEAVFDEVDRITASWPPFDYPYPQVPVRWAKVQGLQELYPAHGDFAFHLDGLPGSWAIPDETHVFFTLPEDPHAERERQRMQARSRAQPDNRMWADAYACGLEAGLDDEIEGPAASGQREAAAWQGLPPGGFHPQHMDPHWNEMAPQQGGMDPDSQPLALPLPPPRSQAPPRGVHLKRPLPNSQVPFQNFCGYKCGAGCLCKSCFLSYFHTNIKVLLSCVYARQKTQLGKI